MSEKGGIVYVKEAVTTLSLVGRLSRTDQNMMLAWRLG